jgi:hypothetical protein
VIDAATRRQIGDLFACQDLGIVELKGLPGKCWAKGRSRAVSRRCMVAP